MLQDGARGVLTERDTGTARLSVRDSDIEKFVG